MAYLGKTPSQAVRSRYKFNPSAGDTSISGNDADGNTLTFADGEYLDVYLNGVLLVSGDDYTPAPSTNTISSLAALASGDVVEIVVYDTFSLFGGDVKGDLTVTNGTLSAEDVTVTGLTTTGNINFGDNDKANFGAGNDLQIYHDSNNSYIKDAGTGNLYINATELRLGNADNSKDYLLANDAGAVTITHNGISRLVTTSTGVDVTGKTVTDGIESVLGQTHAANVENTLIKNTTTGQSVALAFEAVADNTGTGNKGAIYFDSGATGVVADNTLSFNADHQTSSTPDMTIKGDSRVGIGTTSPTGTLHIKTGAVTHLRLSGTSGDEYGMWVTADGSYQRIGTWAHGARIEFAQSNDTLKFLTGTSSAERMRIDSSGNLLVGTTDTFVADNSSGNGLSYRAGAGDLGVAAANTPAFYANRTGTDGAIADFRKGGVSVGSIGSNSGDLYINGSSDLAFRVGDDEKARIDSSGRLGLGTTPSVPLHVVKNGSGKQEMMRIQANDAGLHALYLYVDDTNNHVYYKSSGSQGGSHIWETGNTERMRVTSGGNLLVGKTADDNGTAGIRLTSSGLASFSVSGGSTAIFNRKTSDGVVTTFRKNDGDFGHIRVMNGDNLGIGSSASNHSGVQFGTTVITPLRAGAENDGGIDLGFSNARWKDLYLSGGVIAGSATSKNNSAASNFAAASGDIQVTLERTATSAGWGGIGGNSANALHIYNSSTQKVFEVLQGGKVAYRSEGSTSIRSQTDMRQGSSKFWSNVDGTGTVGISDSYNMTSVTDSGTGLYTKTINNDLNNAAYNGHFNSNMGGGNGGFNNADTFATGSFRFIAYTNTGALRDVDSAFSNIHGDLA